LSPPPDPSDDEEEEDVEVDWIVEGFVEGLKPHEKS
jgi:hypothetical protein